MVSDESSDNLISWGRDGTTFVIKDHNKFSSEMLPLYYKHNNMASFIRQLNMYSFHKVLLVESSSLKNQNELEFSHPNFIRDNPELLSKIQRKIHSKEQTDVKYDPIVFNNLLKEVKQLRAIQELFSSKLTVMKKENAALWREHSILRQRHAKQEKIVNKVIHFLISMVQQSSINVTRRKVPLMIKDRPSVTKPHRKKYVKLVNPKSPPLICEINPRNLINSNEPIIAEEITPEELLLTYNELEPDDTETEMKSNDIDLQRIKSELKADVSGHINEKQKRSILKPVKRKSLIKKNNENNRKRKHEDTESNSFILPIPENELSTLKENVESSPSSKYLLIDSENGLVQFLNDSEEGSLTTSTDNGTSPENNLYPQFSSKTELNANNQQLFTDQGEVEEQLNVGVVNQNNSTAMDSSPNYLMDGSPIAYVTSPSTSVKSPEVNQTPAGTELGTSSENFQEVSDSSPNLLQLAIPTDIHDSIRNKEDAELHLDKVQSDLEILKDLLKGEGISLDANMVLELFNDNPIDLNMGPAGQSSKSTSFQNEISGDQALISYSPSLLDLENELPGDPGEIASLDNDAVPDYVLNTPQVGEKSPFFPDPQ